MIMLYHQIPQIMAHFLSKLYLLWIMMSLNSIEYQCDLNYVRTANWHNLLVSTVAVNKAGDTPLSLECSHGNLEMVKALINEHVDPNSKCLSVLLRCWWWSSTEPVNKAGDIPLSLACANGHLDTVKYLVNQHHCDPKSKHWYIIMVHQLLHHSVHSYMHRYSQQGWWHPTLSGLQTWTLGSGQVSRHHSSLWYEK